jgi:hypothetical protein
MHLFVWFVIPYTMCNWRILIILPSIMRICLKTDFDVFCAGDLKLDVRRRKFQRELCNQEKTGICVYYDPCHEGVQGLGRGLVDPRFLISALCGMSDLLHVPAAFPRVGSHQYQLNKLQEVSEPLRAHARIEPGPVDRPAHSLVTVRMELSFVIANCIISSPPQILIRMGGACNTY